MRIHKYRGGRRKVRKITVLTILRHQNRYGGQIGCNPGNLIEINIINNLSSKSICKEFFCIGLFNARSIGTDEKQTEIKEFVTDQAVDTVLILCKYLIAPDNIFHTRNLLMFSIQQTSFYWPLILQDK